MQLTSADVIQHEGVLTAMAVADGRNKGGFGVTVVGVKMGVDGGGIYSR